MRKLKNGVMVFLLVCLVGALCFTINNKQDENRFNGKKVNEKFEHIEDNIMENNPPEMGQRQEQDRFNLDFPNKNVNWSVVMIESIVISSLIIYLIMSKFNKYGFKETFKNSDKVWIFILGVIVISGGILISVKYLENDNVVNMDKKDNSNDKQTGVSDVLEGKVVSDKIINLSEYDSNITIKEAGEYTLKGNFNHAVLIDAKDDVVLNLEGITIKNDITGAIINKSNNNLILNLVNNATNILEDGGSSEYDACIYSYGALTIKGDGKLEVYGKQEEGEGIATETNNIIIEGGNIIVEAEDDGINAGGDGGTITINNGNIFIKAKGDGIDSNKNLIINGGVIYTMGSSVGGDAGIDTDAGYTINGGLVIALGSDMLETPNDNSENYVIGFNLDEKISENSLITLMDKDNNVIVSFIAKEDFKTLIISSEDLVEGEYYLYKDGVNLGSIDNYIYYNSEYQSGERISVNSKDSFVINKKINLFGKSKSF